MKYEKVELKGGRDGKVFKIANKVVRPANEWTKTVHDFLKFVKEEGADFVPIPYGIEGGNEIVSFIEGDVYNDPLPTFFSDDKTIISAAVLLSKFHEYSARYISKITDDCIWMLEPQYPIEVICHGDFAPYNTVFIKQQATAIIDFDTIHPGSRLWDVAYGVYRWIPFIDNDLTKLDDNVRKIVLFLDTYNLELEARKSLIDVLIERLKSLVKYISLEALNGNKDFERNIKDGHLDKYLLDINYLKTNKQMLIDLICI